MTREWIQKQMGDTWVDFMAPFFQGDQWPQIIAKLKEDKDAGKRIFPAQKDMFRAFREVPLNKVRVVIMGMDPYFKEGYANGLAFAHLNNMKIAAALRVMVDAIEKDAYNGLNFQKDSFNKELTQWTEQGILLLNAALTVVEDNANSHTEVWKPFSAYVMKALATVKRDLIVLAWGKNAQDVCQTVNPIEHFYFTAEHPTFAAREKRDWKCNHFSLTNAVITANNLGEKIMW